MTLLGFAVLIVVAKHAGDRIEDFNGLAKRSPFLAFAMLIAMISLAGVPFTAGFLGKFFIFDAAIRQQQTLLVVIGVITVGCGFYYYLKVVRAMYWLAPPSDAGPVQLSALSRLTMTLLIAAIFVLGVYPQPILNALNQPAGRATISPVPLGKKSPGTLGMFGLLHHLFHPTQCYALCAVARSGAHLLSGALQATHLAGRPLQYFHERLAHKYAARYGLDATRKFCAVSARSPRGRYDLERRFRFPDRILGCGAAGPPPARLGRIWA